MALPSGSLMTAWENLQEEFEPTEGEDQNHFVGNLSTKQVRRC